MKPILKQDSPERAIFEQWKITAKIAESESNKLWDLFDTPETDTGEKVNPKQALQKSLLQEQGYICCYCGKRIGEENIRIEHFLPKSIFKQKTFDYDNLHASCEGGGTKNVVIRSHHKEISDFVAEFSISQEDLIALNPKLKDLIKGKKKFNEIYSKGDKIVIEKSPFSCDNLKGNDANNPDYKGGKKNKNGDSVNVTSSEIISPLFIEIDKRFSYEYNGAATAKNENDNLIKDTITLLGLNNKKLMAERAKTQSAANDNILYFQQELSDNDFLQHLAQEIKALYEKSELDEYCFVMVDYYRSYL